MKSRRNSPRYRCLWGRHGAFRRQAGSAYLMAILALVVLTIIGLSLSFATQTEMVVGSNERVSQRVFFAAESALHVAIARALHRADKRSYRLRIRDIVKDATDPFGPPGWLVESLLEVAPVYPIASPPCNYCTINNSGHTASDSYYKVTHQLTVRGSLIGGNGEVVAQKVITDWVEIQPWKDILPPYGEQTAIVQIPSLKTY
jgi:hypothetical protein